MTKKPELKLVKSGPSSLEEDFVRAMCTQPLEQAQAAYDRLACRAPLKPVKPPCGSVESS